MYRAQSEPVVTYRGSSGPMLGANALATPENNRQAMVMIVSAFLLEASSEQTLAAPEP